MLLPIYRIKCVFLSHSKSDLMKRLQFYTTMCLLCCLSAIHVNGQINTERVMNIGRNALQFEDYVLSIQYFNQVIKLKPYWADPYYYRAVAKLSLDDMRGAEEDATACIERNPYFNNVFYLRGFVRHSMGSYSEAIADYKQGLMYNPTDRNLLYSMAIAHVQNEDYAAADSAYDALFEQYPSYAPGFLMRGQFNILRGDTIAAQADIDKAVSLDKNMASAYELRALLRVKANADYQNALLDMNEAVRLQPKNTGFYINRALVRYYVEDLRGAMADYDYVLTLDPANTMAYYNRGLLRAQVGERNNAIKDFTEVLKREPHNYQAIFNRAFLYDYIGEYEKAIADFDAVIEVYPEYTDALFARSEAKRKTGNLKGGEQDFNLAMKLLEQEKKNPQKAREASDKVSDNIAERKASDSSISKYNRLMVSDNDDLAQVFEPKYESKVRGRIQDRNVQVSLRPMYVLSYYERTTELLPTTAFVDELERINEQCVLMYMLIITNDEPVLESHQITEHFTSATEYSKAIESGDNENVLKYMGRSLDLMLLQDYTGALEDINRVIQLSPNLMLAYFQRATLRYRNFEYHRATIDASRGETATVQSPTMTADNARIEYRLMIQDLDKTIELSPRFGYAYYNRGNLYFAQDEIDAAIADYTQAIALQPDMADAYFNRGLAHLKKGDDMKGREDLSKAGEMGVMAAYNILKRISK